MRMEFRWSPGVELRDVLHAAPVAGLHGGFVAIRPAMEGSMNPLDSITGTIVGGVILALILAALF